MSKMLTRQAIHDLGIIQGIALAVLLCIAFMSEVHAQEGKAAAKKPTRVIDTVCDFDNSEIVGEKGHFVCQYQCRDPDRSKIFQVYFSSSYRSCPTPLKTKIKQTIRDQKSSATPAKSL
jgi:hypothetical protein